MTPQQIKDNAPDRATHYCVDEEGNPHYYKYQQYNKSLMYIDGVKMYYAHNPEESFSIEHYDSLKPL